MIYQELGPRIYNPAREEGVDRRETRLPGVVLLAQKGTEPKVPTRKLRQIVELARDFLRFDRQTKKAERNREGFGKRLKLIAQGISGFRGLILEKDKARVAVFPSEYTTWNRPLLKDALGVAYARVVQEDLIITVHLPIQAGRRTLLAEDISRGFIKALENLGVSKNAIKTLIEQEVDVAVDEQELKRLTETKEIKLPKGAREVKITWNVRPTLLS